MDAFPPDEAIKTEPDLPRVSEPVGALATADNGMTPETRAAWEAKRQEQKFRRLRRKEREREGEIEELNITPMLDMMTIILVFLLKSYNSSTVSVSISNDLLPPISSTRLEPAETATITITKTELTVGDKPAVDLVDWQVPETAKNPKSDLLITPVADLLKKEVDRQKFIAKYNKSATFDGMLSIIGDKDVPYKLLYSVLATAGSQELSNYKFVVLKQGQ